MRTPARSAYDDDMTIFTAISLAGGITEKGSNTPHLDHAAGERADAERSTRSTEDLLQPGDQVDRQTASLVRIVFLNPSGELGGAETALLEMLAALREARPAWTFGLVASAPGPLVERAVALGIPSDCLDVSRLTRESWRMGPARFARSRACSLERRRLGALLPALRVRVVDFDAISRRSTRTSSTPTA